MGHPTYNEDLGIETGILSDRANSPYVTITDTVLAADETVRIQVVFARQKKQIFINKPSPIFPFLLYTFRILLCLHFLFKPTGEKCTVQIMKIDYTSRLS